MTTITTTIATTKKTNAPININVIPNASNEKRKMDKWTETTMTNLRNYMIRTGAAYGVAEVPLDKIVIPTTQREIKYKHVKEIFDKYDEQLTEMPVLNYNPKTNEFEVVDGQHIVTVRILRGDKSTMCVIYDNLSVRIFTNQLKKKSRITSADEFDIRSRNGDVEAMKIVEIASKYGVTICNALARAEPKAFLR